MSVRDTSVDAYQILRDEGILGNRQHQVLTWLAEYIEEKGACPTARELFQWLAVDKAIEEVQLGGPNYVKPRITELKEIGYVEEKGKKECSVTERKAYKLDVVNPAQKNVEGDDVYVDEDGQAYVFDPESEPGDPIKEKGSKSPNRIRDSGEESPTQVRDLDDEGKESKQKVLFENGEVVS